MPLPLRDALLTRAEARTFCPLERCLETNILIEGEEGSSSFPSELVSDRLIATAPMTPNTPITVLFLLFGLRASSRFSLFLSKRASTSAARTFEALECSSARMLAYNFADSTSSTSSNGFPARSVFRSTLLTAMMTAMSWRPSKESSGRRRVEHFKSSSSPFCWAKCRKLRVVAILGIILKLLRLLVVGAAEPRRLCPMVSTGWPSMVLEGDGGGEAGGDRATASALLMDSLKLDLDCRLDCLALAAALQLRLTVRDFEALSSSLAAAPCSDSAVEFSHKSNADDPCEDSNMETSRRRDSANTGTQSTEIDELDLGQPLNRGSR
mmetsp:Transcript_23131/g.60888  ORF Transcript_23131/g.60888 Transcript_23131/m.60888 type:complete len:324 (+) Transcript_23131:663-1634(+)